MGQFKRLLEELKLKLNITWDDEDTYSKLNTIIIDSIDILNYKLGSNIDFMQNGMEHSLFLNYCMYAFNNCEAEFDSNYKSEIMQLRRKYEVLGYENSKV
ncbi:MAG: hypothetical protein R3Y64_07655 [Peptostreptococcaceae bacterium]